MGERGWFSIVNLSRLDVLSFANRTAYCVAKTAIIRIPRMWASEPPQGGVTANAVGPRPTETERFRQNTPAGDEAERNFLSHVLMDRLC
ncbi:SDR family oxidoreductase [Paraburkholderia aromaticivorans]